MATKEPVKKLQLSVKQTVKLTDRELRDLMGVDRPIYEKKGGVWRSK
jgi:hypothetical protein